MKKTLLFAFLFVSFTSYVSAQEQIPNGNFETWETHILGYEYPVGWDNPNAVLSLFGLTPVMPSDDAAEGLKSALLESKLLNATDGEFVIPGVVTLGTFVVDYINNTATLEGGVPFSDRPQQLLGSFKNFPAAGDSTMIVAIFTKYYPVKGKRDTIGIGGLFSKETVSTWTNFVIPIYFNNEDAPDTMNVNVVSSNMINPNKDSYMYIDNLRFEYEAGIGEGAELVETKLFPNPANDNLSFGFGKEVNATLNIYSNEGRIVHSEKISGTETLINVSELATGNYFYNVVERNRQISAGKFMINR